MVQSEPTERYMELSVEDSKGQTVSQRWPWGTDPPSERARRLVTLMREMEIGAW
jgi:hypothetical protein